MENNEYAEIVANDPELAARLKAPDDEYAQIAFQEKQEQAKSLQASAYIASKGDPETRARALDLSKKMKLPTEVVERNLDEVQKQYDMKSFGDYAEIVDKTPGMAKFLQDPDNAILSKDDLDNLRITERRSKEQSFGGDLVDALKYGAVKMASSLAKSPALFAEQNPAGPYGLYDNASDQFEIYQQKKNYKVPEELYKNDLTRYLDEKAAKFAPKDIDADIISEASGGNYAKAGRGFAFQVASNLPQLALIVATRGAGIPLLGMTSASEKNVENLDAGVAPDLARSNALVTGGIEAGIETIGGVGADTFKTSIKAMAKSLGKQGAKEVIKESLKSISKTALEEGAEEWITTVSQGILDYGTGVGDKSLEDVALDAANAFVVGAGSGGVTHGFTLTAEGAAQSLDRYSEYKKAESAKESYLSVGESSLNSKLRQRSPDKHQEYLAEVTAGTASENIYIPVDDAQEYFQSKKINPVEFMQTVGALDSYNEAVETGADIKIPYSVWTANTVDTEHYQGLADDIKFQPEATTINQNKRAEQEVLEELKAADNQAKEEERAIQEKKRTESVGKISETVKDMLLNAGRDETEAKALAQVFAERYSARAESRGLGEDPYELFQQTGLQINKVENPDPQSFIGKMIDGAKALFGAAQSAQGEMALDQGAKKLVESKKDRLKRAKEMGFDTATPLYHGTYSKFDSFKTNPKGVNKLGEGIYFGNEKSTATGYIQDVSQEGRVIEAYVRGKILDLTEANEADQIANELGYPERNSRLPLRSGEAGLDLLVSRAKKQYQTTSERVAKDKMNADLKRLGFSGVKLEEYSGSFIYNIFDPKDIRSVDAKFDPDQSDSSNIYYQSANDRPFQTEIPYPESVTNSVFDGEALTVSEAKDHFKNNIQGKSVTNTMTGWEIGFSKKGRNKAALTIGNEGNRLAFANIDKLMEHAVLARTEEDRRGRDVESDGLRAAHIFYAPFTANGKDYIASIKVNETNAGNKFYDKFALEKETPRAGDAEASVGAGVTPSPEAPRTQSRDLLGTDASTVAESGINIDQFIQDVKNLQDSDPFFQGAEEGARRGRIRFKPGIMSAIELFQHADRSTVIHESGHLWFNELIEDATTEGVPQQLRDDLDRMLTWVGATVRATDGADAIRAGVTVEMHEQMARGFEAYLMEGKAPTQALRKIFAKFKVWLTGVYQRIANLDVILDDDVREVFDRLIAGDEAVSRAEQAQLYTPLDPTKLGMSEAQAERYAQAVAEARQASEDYIRAKLMQDITSARKKFLKQRLSEIKSEVRSEAANMPVYRALSVLQTGKLPDGSDLPAGTEPLRLSRESVEQVFGKEYVKENMPRGIFAKEDGLPYEVVAEAFGYPNGESMILDFANTVPLKEYVNQAAQARLNEEHPDLLNSPEINDEAVKAVHNDKRAHMLRMELEHMATHNLPALKEGIRRISRRVPTEKAVRDQAFKIIGGKTVGELKPYIYQRAEVKAAKEAGVKFTQGDFDGAFEAKRRELLNHELFRAATEASERVETDRKNLKKLFKKDEAIAKTRDVDMVNAGRAILAQFGLASTDKTAAEYLAPIEKYDPDTFQNVMALVESATQNAGPYKTVSYDDFVAMSDGVQAIWELAKSSREMEIDGLKVDRDIIVGELGERLSELIPEGLQPGTGQALTDAEKITFGLKSIKNMVIRVEHWANAMDKGEINGAFTKYIVRPILNAATQYRLKKMETVQKLKDIVQTLEIDNPKAIIDAPEVGYKFTKPELIMALLHTGNESNLKKLLVGRGWGSIEPDGVLNTSKWDAFLLRAQRSGVITKNDYDVVQKIWDLNESTKPDAQKAHKRMYGYYFNEITANPVRTSFGGYRGGYMPAVMDHNISLDANIRAGQEIEESPAQMFPTTGKGFTKSRVENFTTPLSLDFSKIAGHLDKVLRFTYIEPAVNDVTRLVNNRTLRKDLNAFDVSIANELLIPWLKRAATQKAATPGANKNLDRFLSAFRKTSAVQFMVLNVTNMFQNFTSAFPAMVRVNPSHVGGSFKRYLRDPKATAKRIMEASDYMKTRSGSNIQDLMKDIDEVILDPSKFQTFKDEAIHHGYILERFTNGFMELVVWDAAYNQAIAKGLNEKESVNEADATVRQTQSAMNPEDISKYESSSPFVRLFTMFSGFFNTQANLNLSELSKAREAGLTSSEGSKRLARTYAFAIAAPAIASAVIYQIASGKGLDEDDDGEYLDDLADMFFGSQVRYLLAMTPGGSVGSTVVNIFNDKPYDDKISLSPALSNLEKAAQALVSVPKAIGGQGSESKAIKEGLTALGLVTGLPLTPVAKPLGYVADVNQGKAKPTGPLDFARGLATGKKGGP